MDQEKDAYPLHKAKGFGGKIGANTTRPQNYPTAFGLSPEVTRRVITQELKPD